MVPPVDSLAFVTLLYCLNFPEKSKLFSLRFGEKSVSEGLQSKQGYNLSRFGQKHTGLHSLILQNSQLQSNKAPLELL